MSKTKRPCIAHTGDGGSFNSARSGLNKRNMNSFALSRSSEILQQRVLNRLERLNARCMHLEIIEGVCEQ